MEADISTLRKPDILILRRHSNNSGLPWITFLSKMHLIFGRAYPLTRSGLESIL